MKAVNTELSLVARLYKYITANDTNGIRVDD